MMMHSPPDAASASLVFEPFLSGKRLLTTQTFRDLFRSEVIRGTEGIGDLKAFSLVHQHFDRLGKAISSNSGAFVKTIGDAVMASFLNPAHAVKAALEMLREMEMFNKTFTSKDVIIKIGIHTGPSIAVTLNDRLDYLGQTVNIAARVQGLADADEVFITQDVFANPGVRPLLQGCKVSSGKAKHKGVQDEMQVYRIRQA